MRADEFCFAVTDGTHDSPKPQLAGKKLITSKHLKGAYIDFDSANWIQEEDYKKIVLRSKVDQWDILYSMIGTIGNLYMEKNPNTEYACKNVGIFKFGGNKNNAYWLYYYLQSKNVRKYLNAQLRGSTQSYIPLGALREMPVIVPPKDVRIKIIYVLKSLDDKIELNNAINNNLEEQAQAIFDNMFPDISNGENTIGDTITPKRGKGLLSKNAVFGNVPVVAGGLEPSTYHNTANTVAPVLAISASGANAGFVSLWNIPIWSSDSSFIDSSMTDDVYFWYVLLKKRQREIYDSQTGSAQPHIYPQHIAAMPISDLNFDDVLNYTSIVTPIFEMIGHNKDENARLATTRDALLPKLMSGELNVSDIDL